eukprot:RCo054067
MTFVTLYQSRYFDLFAYTPNSLFQSQFHVVTQIRSSCCPLTTTTTTKDVAKDITEYITKISTATKPTRTRLIRINTRMTKLVIRCTFLWIRENFVCFFSFFEFFF